VDKVVIDISLCRAIIFDMDGVVTDSVPAHGQAWQETFDVFLHEIGSDAPRFEESDYLTYVDGKPRYDGVRAFLASRDIELSAGAPEEEVLRPSDLVWKRTCSDVYCTVCQRARRSI
jgi:beta-phosphoglucomutase-like phosphatase (HAD superfamily)